jgi:hypothetical protein
LSRPRHRTWWTANLTTFVRDQRVCRLAVAVLRALSAEAPRLFSDFEIYKADDGAEAARVGYHKV